MKSRCNTIIAIIIATLLTASTALAQASADLQYLQHSGWVVRTPTHILVFDYVRSLPSVPALPDSLVLTAESFDERRVVVFVSHSHEDHFDPVVATWAQKRRDIQYVVGTETIAIPGAKRMKPHETWTSGAMTVRTTGSTDEGVGFQVSVDGMTFYHAGDHARWVDELDADFMAEVQWLKQQGAAIGVAFFPIAMGTTCEPRPAIAQGVRAAARLLQPRVLVPMHVGCADRLELYDRFRQESVNNVAPVEIVAPLSRGARFRYAAGRMTPVTGQSSSSNDEHNGQHATSARAWESVTRATVGISRHGFRTASHTIGPQATSRRYESPLAPGIGFAISNGRQHTFGMKFDVDFLAPVRLRNVTTGNDVDGFSSSLQGILSMTYAPTRICATRCIAFAIGAGAGVYTLGDLADSTKHYTPYAPSAAMQISGVTRDVAPDLSIAPTQIAFAWRAGLDWQPFGRRIVLSVADNVIKFRPSRYAAGISPMHHIMFSVGLRATSSR